MDPPEPLQLAVLERLDAEAQSIDTGVAKTFQSVPLDGFGIRLDRDFTVGIDSESIANNPDDGGDLGRIEQRRRPAAEIDRVDLIVGPEGPADIDVGPADINVGRVFRPGDIRDERGDVA